MNFILDIIIVVATLLFMFIGYKVGFVRVILKIASIFSGLIVAIVLTSTVTKLAFGWGMMHGLSDKMTDKVMANETFQTYCESGGGEDGAAAVLESLGFPKFLAKLVGNSVGAGAGTPEEVARHIGDGIAKAVLTVIVFFVLLFGMSIIFWIIKKLFGSLRESVGLIRFIDGVLGIALFLCFYIIAVDIFFTVIAANIEKTTSFITWMNTQLHLSDEKFGIAKYVYEHNVIKNIFAIFF